MTVPSSSSRQSVTAARGLKPSEAPGGGRVQSLERAFVILETMVDAGGTIGLSNVARELGLPVATIHRIVRTLVDLGYVRQELSRQYTLGPRLIRLGAAASAQLGNWAAPYLSELVEELGETANLAMLDGDQIVYIAQEPGRHSLRMFTEVGRRVDAHCTAVGKSLLALRPAVEVLALLRRTGMEAHTVNTITAPAEFAKAMTAIREVGYAVDEGEQEIGVRCVAVAVPGAPAPLAISVSGPAPRMTDSLVKRTVPLLQNAVQRLADDLNTSASQVS